MFSNSYNRKSFLDLKASSKGTNKTSQFQKKLQICEYKFVTLGWLFSMGKIKAELSERYDWPFQQLFVLAGHLSGALCSYMLL